mmetsp:Transcript_17843/g.62628  ORF Transcript_17843/g.62628 Transcript_17843/m.62628 type:complete len:252 (+) Transcript_17843:2560-3315(+)
MDADSRSTASTWVRWRRWRCVPGRLLLFIPLPRASSLRRGAAVAGQLGGAQRRALVWNARQGRTMLRGAVASGAHPRQAPALAGEAAEAALWRPQVLRGRSGRRRRRPLGGRQRGAWQPPPAAQPEAHEAEGAVGFQSQGEGGAEAPIPLEVETSQGGSKVARPKRLPVATSIEFLAARRRPAGSLEAVRGIGGEKYFERAEDFASTGSPVHSGQHRAFILRWSQSRGAHRGIAAGLHPSSVCRLPGPGRC